MISFSFSFKLYNICIFISAIMYKSHYNLHYMSNICIMLLLNYINATITNPQMFDVIEKEENDRTLITIPVPTNIKPESIKIKYDKNSYTICYNQSNKHNEEGLATYSEVQGCVVKELPYEIRNPKAKIKNGELMLSFQRGENLDYKPKELSIEYEGENKTKDEEASSEKRNVLKDTSNTDKNSKKKTAKEKVSQENKQHEEKVSQENKQHEEKVK
ncbi:hypothetical protein SLOPH_655 [Spraguea lophii 42_110]|uniref:SHSP domain-containing protein n=1 Tax=Spraguea lophii (strain 42_110) TaxID=1358809 RepID=S7WEE5_SPRLO|nr:hypothetical protein SLOPH_655 [Spraguea lophii 42_110]